MRHAAIAFSGLMEKAQKGGSLANSGESTLAFARRYIPWQS